MHTGADTCVLLLETLSFKLDRGLMAVLTFLVQDGLFRDIIIESDYDPLAWREESMTYVTKVCFSGGNLSPC